MLRLPPDATVLSPDDPEVRAGRELALRMWEAVKNDDTTPGQLVFGNAIAMLMAAYMNQCIRPEHHSQTMDRFKTTVLFAIDQMRAHGTVQ